MAYKAIISFNKLSCVIVSKVKLSIACKLLSFIFVMLGCLSYFFIAFNIGSLICSTLFKISGSISMLRFFIALAKNLLKISAILISSSIISLSSSKVIFSVLKYFSENKGLKSPCWTNFLY